MNLARAILANETGYKIHFKIILKNKKISYIYSQIKININKLLSKFKISKKLIKRLVNSMGNNYKYNGKITKMRTALNCVEKQPKRKLNKK